MKILYLFIYLLTIQGFAQLTNYDKYDLHINQANDLKKQNKFKEAITEYEQGLESIDKHLTSTPFFDLAACAIQIQNYDLAKKYILLGITKGGAPFFYLNNYKGFDENYKKTSQWKDVYDDYNNLRKEYFYSIKNIDIYIEIEKMVEVDGAVRSHYSNNLHDKTEILKCKDSFDSVMMNVDNKNIKRLIEISKEYGWQSRAWLLLWHHRGTYKENNFVWNFFIPLINKEIEAGNLYRSFWAAFEDDKSLRENGYTLYGDLPGKVDVKVNERRKLVNLPPLTEEDIIERNSGTDIIFLN